MIPFVKVQDAAKRLGFTGNIEDEKAVRAFVGEAIEQRRLTWNHGGKPVTRALVVEQPDASTVIVMESAPSEAPKPDEGTEQRSVNADDIEKRIAAGIEAAMRKVTPINRGSVDGSANREDAPTIKVRSMQEVFFDDRKRKGTAPFADFETASAFRDALIVETARIPKMGTTADQLKGAQERLQKRGVLNRDGTVTRAYATSPQAAGGALTSIAFWPDIVKNVFAYGVARKLARVVPMEQNTVWRPRNDGTNRTVTYISDNGTSTAETTQPYSNLTLTAKTGIVVSQISNQILADAGIDIAMDIAEDLSRSIAAREDDNFFNGTGTSTYGGMTGFAGKFVLGTSAGAIAGGGDQVSHTDANLLAWQAVLPSYSWPNATIVCHPAAMSRVFNRLNSGTATGVQLMEFDRLGLGKFPSYRGIPIVLSEVVNSTNSTGTTTIDAYIGDFSRCSMIGDRLGVEIAVDNSVGFLQYAATMRAVIRHDVNVFGIEDATTPGPVVALYQT